MHLFSKIRDCLPREELRFATLTPVEIMDEEGALLASSVLRDISTHGGSLHMNGTANLPDRFIVWIPKLGRSVEASIQWRSGGYAGVHFDEEVSLDIFVARRQDRAEKVASFFRTPHSAAA